MIASNKLLSAIVLLATTVCAGSEDDQYTAASYLPRWQYKCVPEKGCQRVGVQRDSSYPDILYPSLDVCRSTCGRFGGLWPRPAAAALSTQTIMFHPKFMKFNLNEIPTETRALLVDMTRVMADNMLAECRGDEPLSPETAFTVDIEIKEADTRLGWNTDESYILDLQTKHADEDYSKVIVHIRATTVFGARHGLETLSQLVSSNTTDRKCSLNILTGAKIKDSPEYKHRGLTLDTSRNFIPIEVIKRTIDGMSSSKMNVLHWHATDSHSFPLQSLRVPLLTRYGAYGEIYTIDQMQELIQYGLVRGVRISLEIDSPAHAGNGWQWGREYGLGDLAVCVEAEPWRKYCIQPPCGQLNPANPNMYKVLRDLYADIVEIWPKGEVFHMGGDEVFLNCWNSSSEITQYMTANGLSLDEEGFVRLWAQFHKKILEIWDEENKSVGVYDELPVVLWSSHLTSAKNLKEYLDNKRFVIQVWEPSNSPHLKNLISQGYRVVASPKNVWYLDHGFWGGTTYSNWRKMYGYKLPKDALVLGGEVAMWTEYVDQNDLDSRIWPRAAAVAERLWSDPVTTPAEVESRMQRHRARLVTRGIKADTISPMWCAQNDNQCT